MPWRFRRRDRDADIRAEIEAHLQMAIRDRIERGESPADARRHAHLEFGSVRAAREDARAVWTWTTVEQAWMDLREGARILTRAPGLSAAAICLIALVIGGNTTIYSAVHGLLTRPAPAVDAEGLVSIGWIADGDAQPETSYPEYEQAAALSRSLRIDAFRVYSITLGTPAGSYALRGAAVTPTYFETLAIPMAHGRTFTAGESRLDSSGLVVVISDRAWLRYFGGAGDVIGRVVRLNGSPATIVGIAPPRFQGVWLAEATDVWVPMLAYARVSGDARSLADHTRLTVHGMVARLAAGATFAEAQAEMAAISTRLREQQPAGTPRKTATLHRYTGVAGRNTVLTRYGPRFLAIFSIVTALTLFIVSANVANLMLARAVGRQREIAVRQSFGASRLRIVRIVLAEGLVISLAAWVVACVFAYWMSQVLPGIIPASESGEAEVLLDFTPDWNVLGYAMLLALVATVVFTLAPAIRAWRQDLLVYLKAGEQAVVQGRSRIAQTLVVLQLAFSVLLLTSAGLGYRSLSLITGTDVGFPTANLLVIGLDTTASARTPDANRILADTILERLRALPGLTAVSHSWMPPATGWPRSDVRSAPAAPPIRAERNLVGPRYLEVLGIASVAGEEFSATQPMQGTAEVIVNQHLADALWPGEPAVGRTLLVDPGGRPATVRAVAPNALLGGFRRDERPRIILFSARQQPPAPGFATFYARYTGTLETVVPSITRALGQIEAGIPAIYIRTMEKDLAGLSWTVRTLTALLVTFAAGSLLIAALGQYAAMSFTMRRRVRDFGIRIAMGASPRQILASALAEGFRLTVAGLSIGAVLGFMGGRAGRGLLYGVTPNDARTYAAVMAVLGIASLAACYLPARRAARLDPLRALREE